MLVPMRAILETADQFNYAQGSFNVNAVAQAKAAIAVHEQFRSPAILQGADLANAFMGGRPDFMNGTVEDKIKGAANIGAAVKRYGENSPVPVALHLDHGKNMESVKAAIAGGYTSVMIDGSSLSFEDNVERRGSGEVCPSAGRHRGGELGVLAGMEDHVFSSTSTYTNPLKAVSFQKTKCVPCHQLWHHARSQQGQGHQDPQGDRHRHQMRHEASVASSSATARPRCRSISGDQRSHPQRLWHRADQLVEAGAASARSMWTPTSAWLSPQYERAFAANPRCKAAPSARCTSCWKQNGLRSPGSCRRWIPSCTACSGWMSPHCGCIERVSKGGRHPDRPVR
ncbi:class II fructose-bisphosphate aldolase [Ruthenibacterium lactatiformans]|uniref:class II fructose-bisphosphate aldolase n=1 Tax=Ruthenibacterium lactatiformans TaxID=1550024 RepID=UPI0039930730